MLVYRRVSTKLKLGGTTLQLIEFVYNIPHQKGSVAPDYPSQVCFPNTPISSLLHLPLYPNISNYSRIKTPWNYYCKT